MKLSEYDLEKREKADAIPSPGKCIYCYRVFNPEELTDEHVIPYALAADTLIFLKSCCQNCQKEITRYEQGVLRHQLGAFRAQIDAPTRKMKDRAKALEVHFVEINENAEVIRDLGTKQIPIDEAPVIVNLWQSPPARIFQSGLTEPDGPWSHFVRSEIDALNNKVRAETGAVHVAMRLGRVNKLQYQRFLV